MFLIFYSYSAFEQIADWVKFQIAKSNQKFLPRIKFLRMAQVTQIVDLYIILN